MKKRRKHSQCLNCGQNLHDKHNYCANCGQENTDNEVGFSLLVREFTSNFFSLDSRFGRTLLPFLIRPGNVTNAFNEGKRVLYANPIRWYLVVSLIHFFLMTKYLSPESLRRESIQIGDGESLTAAQVDSIMAELPKLEADTSGWPISDRYLPIVNYFIEEEELLVAEVMDTLQFNKLPWLRRNTTRQLIKVSSESQSSLSLYMLRQIPIMVFFVLPISAMLLKLFFWRSGRFIHHMVHSLHLHSFALFTFGILWLALIIFPNWSDDLIWIAYLVTMVYLIFSFRNVYLVRWFTAIWKLFLLSILYTISFIIVFIVGILLSFALF